MPLPCCVALLCLAGASPAEQFVGLYIPAAPPLTRVDVEGGHAMLGDVTLAPPARYLPELVDP